MTSIGELFPKCRKLAYDARQQLAVTQQGTTSSVSELYMVLEELNRDSGGRYQRDVQVAEQRRRKVKRYGQVVHGKAGWDIDIIREDGRVGDIGRRVRIQSRGERRPD